jgi:hypothetical protein
MSGSCLLLLIFRSGKLCRFQPRLAGVGVPLPIGDCRLSVVAAIPEFRMASKMVEVAIITINTIQRNCPSAEQLKAILGVLAAERISALPNARRSARWRKADRSRFV